MLKAIETRYNNYRFRSRLEARWAIWLDTLGIKYEYEKEGYDFGDDGWYLPDFWLSELQCWLEIKGTTATHEESNKAFLLAERSGYPVILCAGSIGCSEYAKDTYEVDDYALTIFVGYHNPSHHPVIRKAFPHFAYQIEQGHLQSFLQERLSIEIPTFDGSHDAIKNLIDLDRQYYRQRYGEDHPEYQYGITTPGVWDASLFSQGRISGLQLLYGPVYSKGIPDPIVWAYAAARSARFEHGERGR